MITGDPSPPLQVSVVGFPATMAEGSVVNWSVPAARAEEASAAAARRMLEKSILRNAASG